MGGLFGRPDEVATTEGLYKELQQERHSGTAGGQAQDTGGRAGPRPGSGAAPARQGRRSPKAAAAVGEAAEAQREEGLRT
mmetsp:Transcript_28635/g.13259  ORF Transcript_28635/g.13259 Transcript_28635/m.13259 type:complete len:80 (+) Transcript_28635:65-304(+)